MTHGLAAHLYHDRTLLSGDALAWADRRLTMVDGHHIAKVHEVQGVIEGFGFAVDETGTSLTVGPGWAYTPCGDLVGFDQPQTLPPPPTPGSFTIAVTDHGRLLVAPGRPDPTTTVALGTAVAATRGHGVDVIWVETSTAGRPLRAAVVRPQIASGQLNIGIHDFYLDQNQGRLSVRVNTENGQFERTPLYFVSLQVPGPASAAAAQLVLGWYVDLCSPGPVGFTANLYLATSGYVIRALPYVLPAELELTLTWTGIDHRRTGPDPAFPNRIHADRPCATVLVESHVSPDEPLLLFDRTDP